ncbi:MAG: ATP-binding protein, partial [Proteobacteria bacterium]|nr:ATP-binding protein [Pseudomonadota bacterium]
MTNAVKFSYPDSKIIIKVVQHEEHIALSVRDFGIGIPKRILDHIFNINKNTNRSGTRGEPGNGFGMPLVKKYITLY